MNDTSQVIHQILGHDYFPLWLILLGLLISFFINRKKLQAWWLNVKTQRCLNSLGADQILNINCPDGLGHYFNIDRLLLRQEGISLLIYKKYPGKIFCADRIDEWTQMLGQKSYNFKNPLFDLEYQIKALSTYFPGIDINGYLFFDHNAEFPKGHPERIIHPQQVPQELNCNDPSEVAPHVLEAWERFKAKTDKK